MMTHAREKPFLRREMGISNCYQLLIVINCWLRAVEQNAGKIVTFCDRDRHILATMAAGH
jgi:hypothetical protein